MLGAAHGKLHRCAGSCKNLGMHTFHYSRKDKCAWMRMVIVALIAQDAVNVAAMPAPDHVVPFEQMEAWMASWWLVLQS